MSLGQALPAPRPGAAEADAAAAADSVWWLYLLACENGYTYAGTARNPQVRFQLHRSGKGARFTRINRPLEILGAQRFADRAAACRAEYLLKQLSPADKQRWAANWPFDPDNTP